MGGDWSWEKGGAYINVPVVIEPKRKPRKKAKKKPVARRKPRPSRKGR